MRVIEASSLRSGMTVVDKDDLEYQVTCVRSVVRGSTRMVKYKAWCDKAKKYITSTVSPSAIFLLKGE